MSAKHDSGSERRKYKRAHFDTPVTVHPVVESKSGNVFEVQDKPLTVNSVDLSEGGIRLGGQSLSSKSNIYKLNFQVQKNRMVDVYSKLAWAAEGMVGLQFIVADEEMRKMIRGYVDKSL
ncbi:MAG TPA: PilZ domain-containing protein [bacterium]|nr:PilZ domain-containing protein [bacterium]